MMEKSIASLYQVLHQLTGQHRQLLETVRVEKDALLRADLSSVQTATVAKQKLLEGVQQNESVRQKITAELAMAWKIPYRDLNLPRVVIEIQGRDPKAAEQLRSIYNALTILIQRISTQNSENRIFIENSLQHIHQMKKNILGESNPNTGTYTQTGQKLNAPSSPRLISKEA